METVRSTLKGIHVAWDQFQDDTKTLEQIQDVARSARGRNQIEQAGNPLSIASACVDVYSKA